MAEGSLNFDPSRGTRRYSWGGATTVGAAAATDRVGPIDAHEIMVSGSVPFHLAVGDATVEADTSTHPMIAAGVPFHLQITAGQYVAAIRAGADDGLVAVLVVAT